MFGVRWQFRFVFPNRSFETCQCYPLRTYNVSPPILLRQPLATAIVPRCNDGKFITLLYPSPTSRLLIFCPRKIASFTACCIEKNEENRHCLCFTTFGRVVAYFHWLDELWCALVWRMDCVVTFTAQTVVNGLRDRVRRFLNVPAVGLSFKFTLCPLIPLVYGFTCVRLASDCIVCSEVCSLLGYSMANCCAQCVVCVYVSEYVSDALALA